MLKIRVTLFILTIVCGRTWAVDQFEGIRCGADIPKALIGKRNSSERVVVTEGRHKDLGLKDLGGIEISDRLFLVSWELCGSEYELLVNTKSGRIRDVIPFPPHSGVLPQFIGTCQVAGKEMPEAVVAVLDNSAGRNARESSQAKTMLIATAAWKIDETQEKFVKQSTENLGCPLGGIDTVDGGP